ncbi:LEA type 2 family protein [Wenzhouxiangella sp. XN79A]|uniref:LEA type 2 family protein n=1 Tax=Wenzhouxiangella sp. XN79A TaxID=2724193 RepID=UPI00144AAF4B|nr:LEA type 2 family protein [Wenzhouxiangella sp. XN79A]NKI36120.1 LEA type 2 family protein [Wenzhouxiangella sp. XN79A]
MPHALRLVVPFVVLVLTGCAGLGVGREPPSVFLQSFRAVPDPAGAAGLPAFEIELRVINPNPEPLRLHGAVYSVRLDGRKLIEGVANDLPAIDGYGEGRITLSAAVDVLGGVRLLADLMNQPRDRFEYSLDARLDPVGFSRDIRISETGQIDLQPR